MRSIKRLLTTLGSFGRHKGKNVTWWVPALFLLSAIATPQAFSQVRVLQVILTENPGHLMDVTRRSMAVELERAGMEVESREVHATDEMDPENVSYMAASSGAQYVAQLRFDNVGDRARFEMVLYDGGTGRTLSKMDRENVQVELEYDTVVARSTRDLLAEAGVRFDRPVSEPASLRTAPHPPASQEDEPPGFQQITRSPEAPETEREAPAVGRNGFALGVSVAPALVTGKASDYLKFGFLAALSGGYRIQRRSATLGVGLLGGVGVFYPENTASGFDVYLAPFGPSLRMETSSSENLRVGLRASGGPALLSIRNSTQPDLIKLIPYVLGGVEISYQVSHSILVRLESNYTVFFEEVHPIMAFSPTLAIKWQR